MRRSGDRDFSSAVRACPCGQRRVVEHHETSAAIVIGTFHAKHVLGRSFFQQIPPSCSGCLDRLFSLEQIALTKLIQDRRRGVFRMLRTRLHDPKKTGAPSGPLPKPPPRGAKNSTWPTPLIGAGQALPLCMSLSAQIGGFSGSSS
jgi:hypothetical protein